MLAIEEVPSAGVASPAAGKRAGRAIWRSLLRNKPALLGVAFLTLLLICTAFAGLVAPHDPQAQSIPDRLLPPFWSEGGSATHLLGTDRLGRDVLSRVIFGSRVSLFVGVATVLVAGSLGTAVGMASGYIGGVFDSIVAKLVDVQIAFPGLLLAMGILTVVDPGTLSVTMVLMIGGWPVYTRLARALTLSLKESVFVDAAELIACSRARILIRHVLPNILSPMLTLAVLQFAVVVLAEASLSFLGIGVQPPTISWGLDLSVGRDSLLTAWWLVTFPGLAIALTVLSLNLVASWLRVELDPVERAKRGARTARTPVLAARPTDRPEAAPGEATPLLSIRDLHVEFPTERGTVMAVRGVSLDIRPGEAVGLVGESGSGKSVTANAIVGMIEQPGRVTSGDIVWKGSSLLWGDAAERRVRQARGREIGLVFQDPMTSLNPVRTVQAHLTEVLETHTTLSGSRARERSRELLELVGIPAPDRRLTQYPHELSGGMRQRVMIALALACDPDLLIADEPTTALDVSIQAQILELLSDLRAELGLAILLITHDLGVVGAVCDRVEVMYAGALVESAPTDAIFDAPVHPYTSGLIAATPQLATRARRLSPIAGAPPDLRGLPQGCAFAPRCARATATCTDVIPVLTDVAGGVGVDVKIHRSVACYHPLEAERSATGV